jgi:ankyrin repeat protein
MIDTRLPNAAGRGDTDEVLALLSEVPQEYRAEELYSALLSATTGEKLDTMRALIAAGADVNAAYRRGHRILAAAAKKGNIDAVRLLLEYGADVSARDPWGKTAFDYARKYRRTAVMALLEEISNAR